jgi:hypothetical protein
MDDMKLNQDRRWQSRDEERVARAKAKFGCEDV